MIRQLSVYAAAAFVAFGAAVAPRMRDSLRERNLVEQAAEHGRLIGGHAAGESLIVEFADYQCPVCALADSNLRGLPATLSPTIRFHHYPLEGLHPFAYAAAIAAECAGDQDRFEAMHHILFRQQLNFGQVSWRTMAGEAGVADLAAFDACLNGSDAPNRVARDAAMAAKLGLRGTPAFLIGGRIYYGARPDTLVHRRGEHS